MTECKHEAMLWKIAEIFGTASIGITLLPAIKGRYANALLAETDAINARNAAIVLASHNWHQGFELGNIAHLHERDGWQEEYLNWNSAIMR